jgi:hypothetical protein
VEQRTAGLVVVNLTLIREPSAAESTKGVLFVDGRFECFTLEDVIRDGPKVHGATAIPAGRYKVIVSMSPRFRRRLPLLLAVPWFEGIRIHPGNHPRETEGCILVGRKRSDDPDTVLESRLAFAPLLEKLEAAGEAWITIINPGGLT